MFSKGMVILLASQLLTGAIESTSMDVVANNEDFAMSKARTVSIWVLIALASLAFAAAGVGKLMGVPQMHMSFSVMGLPEWFGYFIGACELLGAVGLLVRRLSAAAAGGLLVIMLGAIFFHVYFEVASHGVPAMILAAFMVFIFRARAEDAFWVKAVA